MTILQRMNSQVHAELTPYPRGQRASAQNLYRAAYQMARMHSLGAKSSFPDSSPSAVHQVALNIVRMEFPGFVPVER